MTASGNGTFKWSTGETTAGITVSPAQTTTYTVTINDGRTDVSGFTVVTVKPLPVATINPAGPTTFCEGGNVLLNDLPGLIGLMESHVQIGEFRERPQSCTILQLGNGLFQKAGCVF